MITVEAAQVEIAKKYNEIMEENKRQRESISELFLASQIGIGLLTNILMDAEGPNKTDTIEFQKSFLKIITDKVQKNIENPKSLTIAKVYID